MGCDLRRQVPCSLCHSAPGEPPPFRQAFNNPQPAKKFIASFHNAHLSSDSMADMLCDNCHIIPQRVEGHFDNDGRATVTPDNERVTDVYIPENGQCQNGKCHVIFDLRLKLSPSVFTEPTQRSCAICHTLNSDWPLPNGKIHPRQFAETFTLCHTCHSDTVDKDGRIKFLPDGVTTTHLDGLSQVKLRSDDCDTCHKIVMKDEKLIRFHNAHKKGGSGTQITAPIPCGNDECHMGYGAGGETEHPSGGRANVSGASYSNGRCAEVWCHMPEKGGTLVPDIASAGTYTPENCDGCHKSPPTENNHPPKDKCGYCHTSAYTGTDGKPKIMPEGHIDGKTSVRDTDCKKSGCHEEERVRLGRTFSQEMHDTHEQGVAIMIRLSNCATCHPPRTLSDPEHMDGVINADKSVCPICHNSQIIKGKGTMPDPEWYPLQWGIDSCLMCHRPAGLGHWDSFSCGKCHPTAAPLDREVTDNVGHGDGRLNVKPGLCLACHDPETKPPHAKHGPYVCGECHPPQSGGGDLIYIWDTKHMDMTVNVPLQGAIATANGAMPQFDPRTKTCTVYCHYQTTPVWGANPAFSSCTSCHAAPPPNHSFFSRNTECGRCHTGSVQSLPDGNNGYINVIIYTNGRTLHANGSVD